MSPPTPTSARATDSASGEGRWRRGAVALFAGTLGLAFFLTLLWFGMRSVLDIGGMCASGGPYQIAVECPDNIGWPMPLSIWLGLMSAGLMAFGAIRVGATGLVLIGWPALFLSLGGNFLEYGVRPPGGGGLAWGWLVCGVVFVLMGAPPLLALRQLSEVPRRGMILLLVGAAAAVGVVWGTMAFHAIA
ncbi:MAG TPA: hypothetical protein PKE32_00755 [Miltoncostaeaceae bacterium]|nr:hypothetical protein [Miltoncostaeaceae bacterium]